MQLEAGLVAALHGNPRRRSHTSQLLRGAALPVVGVVSSSGGSSGRQDGHCARSNDAGTSFGCAAIAGGCSASPRRRCRTQPPALHSCSVIIPAQWRPTQVGRFTRRQSTVVERCTSALQCALQGCKVERVDAVKMPSSRVAQGRSWLRRCLACVGS